MTNISLEPEGALAELAAKLTGMKYSVDTPENLRRARCNIGLTQAQVGRELGVSRQMVCDMEAGREPVTRRTDLAMRYLWLTSEFSPLRTPPQPEGE